jgi:hypothetical protein
MHAVRRELVTAQAHAAGCRSTPSTLPGPVPTRRTRREWPRPCSSSNPMVFTHIAFGDLFSRRCAANREDRLAGTGLTPLFPLWKTMPTRDACDQMIESGLAPVDLRGSARAAGVVRRTILRARPARRSARGVDPAAKTANSIRSSGTGRCSRGRSRLPAESMSNATASSSRTSFLCRPECCRDPAAMTLTSAIG